MIKKVLVPALLLVALLFQMTTAAWAAAREYYYDGAWHPYSGNEFKLSVNGETLTTSMPPIVFDDYSVVPAREVFEHLGAKVDWDGTNSIVKITYSGKIMLLRINSKAAQIGTQTLTMPIAPKIINEKTMVPVRFVAEAMGLRVEFDSSTDTILIEKAGKSVNITSVKWEKNKAGTAGFLTVMTDAQEAEYSAFTMEGPSRIVLDIADAVNKTGKSSLSINTQNVQQLRIGDHEDSTRLVIDLAENAGYTVESDGPSIVVTVRLKEVAQPSVSPTASPTPPATAAPSSKPTASASPSSKPPAASASPTVASTSKSKEELSRYVTIDAGHGGIDPGTIYRDSGGKVTAQEKDINLAVALKVQKKLEAAGVKVHMIRTTDTYVDYQKVGSIANSMGTSLFVSIHTNSAEPTSASGIEVWGYLMGGSDYAGMTSKRLSQNLLDELIAATGAKDRGVKDGKELAVIHTTQMPAALIEVGFITNTEEREKLMSDDYRETLAEAVTRGILKSLDEMGL